MIPREFLNLAGEYRVCAELLKRSIYATITYGNHKAVDIFVLRDDGGSLKIEVKGSNSNRFVTGFYQKYGDPKSLHPDFWVLYSTRRLADDTFEDEFFVLTHDELALVQAIRNCKYDEAKARRLSYKQRANLFPNGVDNVLKTDLERYAPGSKNNWKKIESVLKNDEPGYFEELK